VEFRWDGDLLRSAPSLLTPIGGDFNQSFDNTSDGRRALTLKVAETEGWLQSEVMRVVINWVDELGEQSP
jgi:hypothetical protein